MGQLEIYTTISFPQSLQSTAVKQGMGKRRQRGRTKQTSRKMEQGRAKKEMERIGKEDEAGKAGRAGGRRTDGISSYEVRGRKERKREN